MTKMQYPVASKIVKQKVCARCYGHLKISERDYCEPGEVVVTCPDCGDGYRFVSPNEKLNPSLEYKMQVPIT